MRAMPHPLLYEINTRCWLRELSDQAGEPITLANVPDFQFAAWQMLGFTHLWLMGVWATGPRARAEALNHPGLRAACDQILPGWTEADITGSPYAVDPGTIRKGDGTPFKVFTPFLRAWSAQRATAAARSSRTSCAIGRTARRRSTM